MWDLGSGRWMTMSRKFPTAAFMLLCRSCACLGGAQLRVQRGGGLLLLQAPAVPQETEEPITKAPRWTQKNGWPEEFKSRMKHTKTLRTETNSCGPETRDPPTAQDSSNFAAAMPQGVQA